MNAAAPEAPVTAPREITHRRVLNIAVPIVLSNATVPILGAVDTGVVGQMGAAAPIGAVGIGALGLSAIYWVFGFLRMGTVGRILATRRHRSLRWEDVQRMGANMKSARAFITLPGWRARDLDAADLAARFAPPPEQLALF